MADIEYKISELVGADPLSGTEVVPLVQNSQTRIRTVASLVAEGGLDDHEAAPDPHSQYMLEANNLSDVADPSASRSNIDVYSITETNTQISSALSDYTTNAEAVSIAEDNSIVFAVALG